MPARVAPNAAANRRQMRLRGWKRLRKGSLIGFANIALPFGPAELEVDDLPVLVTNGRAWATWPGKPILTKEGTLAKLPGTGKTHYVNVLKWGDRQTAERFSAAVVDLVREADPEAFEDGGQP